MFTKLRLLPLSNYRHFGNYYHFLNYRQFKYCHLTIFYCHSSLILTSQCDTGIVSSAGMAPVLLSLMWIYIRLQLLYSWSYFLFSKSSLHYSLLLPVTLLNILPTLLQSPMTSPNPLHRSPSPDSGPFDPNVRILFEEYITKSDAPRFRFTLERWRRIP